MKFALHILLLHCYGQIIYLIDRKKALYCRENNYLPEAAIFYTAVECKVYHSASVVEEKTVSG